MLFTIIRNYADNTIVIDFCTEHIRSDIEWNAGKGRITMVDPVSGRLWIDICAYKVRKKESLIQLFLTLTA